MSLSPLYGVIEYSGAVKKLSEVIASHDEFVVKPARGSGGNGIVVITGRMRDSFRKANGALIDLAELEFHVQNALSGVYSLGGQTDKVLIEYRVRFDTVFEKIAWQGVPDVRVIVYRGIPVMAMVRLPTRMSGGKANLHQGAIGVGIDIADGRTLTAVWGNDIVNEHPDTYQPVNGVAIPHWDRILEIPAGAYELTGLGYQGVDIVLDRDKGPLILELNARPGLNIQIANRAGLVTRLEVVDGTDWHSMGKRRRIAFAKNRFAAA
jgi:alpha-L-glutamate ligase-like protein